MSQLQVTGEAKIRDIQGPVVANDGVITALDGAANQYVRGDGTLASFPTSGGGGSSVSYYLNGSVNQGTFGGSTYYQMSKDAITGAGTNFSTSSNGLLAQFITDANDPDVVSIPSGNWNVEFFMGVSASSGSLASFYVEIYKYDGSTFTLLATNVATPEFLTNTTTVDAYFTSVAMPLSAMALTDRLAVRIYANVASKTVTLYTEDNRLCQVVTTFSKGILSINNLTDQSQNLTTGTSGTNFAIVSSGDTHTFNLPVASATNTGKLSSTDWTTFNNKQDALTNPITGTGAAGKVAYFDGTTSITSESSFIYDASTNRLGVNTTTPNATIGANASTDSGYSLLLKNDNANYNGIGFGTDSTYGNLIATEKLGTAPARNLTLINQSGFISLTEAGNLGVGILTPNTGLDIYNGTSSYLWLHTANSGVGGTDGVRLALFSTNGANLRNFEGSFSITAEGDFSIITIGAENFRVNSADGSIYQSKVSNAMLKAVSGVITAAVAGTDYLAPSAISGTTNTIPKFTSSSALGNSNITDTGSLITLGSTSYVSSGNFGVGTATPAVSGVGIDIYSATSAGLRFHTATSGTTVSDGAGINFSSANNLGITNYEAGAIDIVTNGNSGVYINQLGYVGINGATPSSELTVNGNAAISGLTTGQIVFPTTGGLLIGSSSLFWDNTNGRLGIGTSTVGTRKVTIYSLSPAEHLHLVNNAPSLTLSDNFTATYFATFGMATANNNFITGAVAGDLCINTNSANSIFFGNSNTSTPRMKLNSSGNLLINTTTDNGANLNVNGVIYGTRARLNNSYDNASVSLNVGGQTYMDSRTSRLYQTYNLSSMSNYMHIYDPYATSNANGGISIGASSSITTLPSTSIIHFDGVNNRVGIGTTAPSAALSVVGAVTASGRINSGNGGGATASLNAQQLSGDDSAIYAGGVATAGSSKGIKILAGTNTSDYALNVASYANSPILYARGDGNVGIGTSTPNEALTIAGLFGNIRVYGRSGVSNNSISSNLYYDGTNWLHDNTSYGAAQITLSAQLGAIIFGTTGATSGDATERMRITSGGEVVFQNSIQLRNGQINSLTSGGGGQSMYLNFQGNGAIYAGSSYAVLYAGSDRRIKTDIVDAESTLNKILSLTPRTFKYKERPEFTNYGFIAQEVEEVMPEIVKTSEGITMCDGEEIENQKSIESYGLSWASILVKAIQEQQAQIEELKALIAAK